MLSRWRRASLRVRLLVQLLISFGVILAAFLFISIKEIDNSTQQALQERQLVAQLMAERADNQMSYAQRVLENAIQDPDMDLDDGDLEPEKKLLQGVFEHSSLFKRVLLMNSSGIVTWLAPYTTDATRLIGVDMAAAPYNIPFSGATQPFFYEMLGVRTQTPGIALLLPIRNYCSFARIPRRFLELPHLAAQLNKQPQHLG